VQTVSHIACTLKLNATTCQLQQHRLQVNIVSGYKIADKEEEIKEAST